MSVALVPRFWSRSDSMTRPDADTFVSAFSSAISAVSSTRSRSSSTPVPAFAEMGTIRGDFSVDSPVLANAKKRAIHNLIHASGNLEEAMHVVVHDKLLKLDGEGGMIGVDAKGNAAMIFNSEGMYRAVKSSDGKSEVRIYK